jgi:FtsP/CotA-like multicopper oxidase with cupredoxin domain
MPFDRRTFLKGGGLSLLAPGVPACTRSNTERAAEPESKPDYTIRIATGLVDLGPGHIVSTTLYNDQFPGPLLRFKEGQRVVVDVFNDTDTPELVHWHGQMVPSEVDGASE